MDFDYEVLGQQIVSELADVSGSSGYGPSRQTYLGIEADSIINAASELAKKGVSAYQNYKNPNAAPASSTAIAPTQQQATFAPVASSGNFFSTHYGGLPGWAWIVGGLGVLTIGFLLLKPKEGYWHNGVYYRNGHHQ